MELLAQGVAGWRITVRHSGPRAVVLDAVTRTGAAFLRTDHAGLEEAIELGWLPGITTRVSVEVDSLEGALDAIAAGAGDLVVGDWNPSRSAPCATPSPRGRSSSAPRCRPRPRSTTPARRSRVRCSPPG